MSSTATMTAETVGQVYVVFKTHLDVGFTDFARNVVRAYMTSCIPKALDLAKRMREKHSDERFVWTTGSWLIYEYLEQASPRNRGRMEEAITAGDICWHALPFTTHSELMDADLFRFGIGLSRELDRRFGRKTISAKMTDVPGHTRAIVPLLAEAGVRFLHVGVNPASKPPDVPPLFRWQSDGAEVVVMYQGGGYGGVRRIPGGDAVLAFAHTGDNNGPQSDASIREFYDNLHRQYPRARITASGMDPFARRLLRVRNSFPVVTGELGDTWIHGVGSDPGKVARFRELCRLRRQWLDSKAISPDDCSLAAFSRRLLLVPEHTWGMDEKTHLGDWENYTPDQLRRARSLPKFARFEASWAEQRSYLSDSLRELTGTAVVTEARKALRMISPRRPQTRGFKPVDPSVLLDSDRYTIGFDRQTGAIVHLLDKAVGRHWAAPSRPLALFRYQTFSQADYNRFMSQYLINMEHEWCRPWAVQDFSKPGIEHAGAEHCDWLPELQEMLARRTKDELRIVLLLTAAKEAVTLYGCPRVIAIEVRLHDGDALIEIDVQWFGKQACRLPEAIWFSFVPLVAEPDLWCMDKMGVPVSPLEVVSNGNRTLHAVQAGVSYRGPDGSMEIASLDAALVGPRPAGAA